MGERYKYPNIKQIKLYMIERNVSMRKKREITIKVIEDNNININRLIEFFTRKYSENKIEKS